MFLRSALCLLISAPVHAQTTALGDPHLSVLPRGLAKRIADEAVSQPTADFTEPELGEASPGGAATVPRLGTEQAFSVSSANISADREVDFKLGNVLFRKLWQSVPSPNQISDGLGPLYNARSCEACHIRDGRGHPPAGKDATSFLLKIAIPDIAAETEIEGYIATRPDPTYGTQLQEFANPGHQPEFKLRVTYTLIILKLSGGETATLRHPTYRTDSLAYGPRHPESRLSPRIAPQMIGLGLLEAIPAQDILALADPHDVNKDGISGRPNIITSAEFQHPMLGRFGHKAAAPTIRAQSAAAFVNDIGISSPLHPQGWGDCTATQIGCQSAPNGNSALQGNTEISAENLDFITHYSRNLGVPARDNPGNSQTLRGKQLFYKIGCAGCHQPKFITHTLVEQPELSDQLIWPYTDLLLHDMGDGLADNFPEGRATGHEWRTAPLWGIGLTKQVSGHSYFLHDGRARNLLEAILWHGGEAEAQRQIVIDMPKDDRALLIRFLESL